jgi:hypothetical protein
VVGDGESAGLPDGLLGSAGLPDGFIGLFVLTLPAVLPLVVPFDIPVVVPVVPGVPVPGDAVPDADPAPPVPAPPAPPACASANVLESANTVANAGVVILMVVSLG